MLTAGGLATSLLKEELLYEIKSNTVAVVTVVVAASIFLIVYTTTVLGIQSLDDLEDRAVAEYKFALSYVADLLLDLVVLLLQFFVEFTEGVAVGMFKALTNFSFPKIKIEGIKNPFKR